MPICYHPELIPTGWDQQKPEPCEMSTCGCGENANCPVCGFGWGAYPCSCRRHEALLVESVTEYAGIWQRLADA